jgi:hypothetical protein
MEQQGVHGLLVIKEQLIEFVGHGKHHMKVLYGQQILFAGYYPLFLINGTALRTMPISAGVVGDPELSAILTSFNMSTHISSTTLLYGIQHSMLISGKLAVFI